MKISSSVEFVWQLASQEAIASHHPNITIELFFAVMLKLTELGVNQLHGLASKPGADQELMSDLSTLRTVIREKSIRGPEVRRKLMAEIGSGNARHEGGVIHRSPDCKAFFDTAMQLACETHCDEMTPVHLLTAMLSSPIEIMVKVLARPGVGSEPVEKCVQPKQGRAVQTPTDPQESTTYVIEARALIQALAHPSGKSVAIITQEMSVVHDIITMANTKLAAREGSFLKHARIVDLSRLQTNAELNRSLRDASTEKGIVLYLPPIKTAEHIDQKGNWLQQLEEFLEGKNVQCACGMTFTAYNDLVRHNTIWKKRVHPIWIRDKDNQEIPNEL